MNQNTEKLFTNALTKVFNLERYYLQTINPLGLKQTKSCLCKREMLNIQGNWMFVFPQNVYVETLSLDVIVLGSGGLWEAIRFRWGHEETPRWG